MATGSRVRAGVRRGPGEDFYRDQVGFHEDFDTWFNDDLWMVQLTPPGSGCSIALLTGMGVGPPGSRAMEPGSLSGLQVVVLDVTAARATLIEHGVEVSEVMEVVHEEGGSVYRPVTASRSGGTPTHSSRTRTATGGSSSRARPRDSAQSLRPSA